MSSGGGSGSSSSEPTAKVTPVKKEAGDEDFEYEEVELDEEDDGDEMNYEEVPAVGSDEDSDSDDEDGMKSVLATIKQERESRVSSASSSRQQSSRGSSGKRAGSGSSSSGNNKKKPSSQSQQRGAVVDDFIRNFLIKHNMNKTLDAFQAEWYQLKQEGKLKKEEDQQVPDIYARCAALEDEVKSLETQLTKTDELADKARSTWDKLRKERDFHRMHHRRVVQEKNKLITDMKRLKKHYSKYQPMIQQLRKKYDQTVKDRTMIGLARDKLLAKVEALEKQLSSWETLGHGDGDEKDIQDKRAEMSKSGKHKPLNLMARRPNDARLPPDERINPLLDTEFPPVATHRFTLRNTFQGHSMPVSGLAHHPTKPIVATASDDCSWKLWSLPKGELIMSGDGHKDFVSNLDFHPSGGLLSTVSGDGTLKVWDLKQAACVMTFKDHTQALWDCTWHDSGDFVASASMDHSAKLFDVQSQRCRQTLRGHAGSVDCVRFLPFSNTLCTTSGDKSVSLWDLRSGLCVQTFYGHDNAVHHCDFSVKGDSLLSSDADGVVKVWDLRTVGERLHINSTGSTRHPANEARFDKSGTVITVCSDDSSIKVFDAMNGKHVLDLEGHEDAVQACVYDPSSESKYLVSCGSDSTFRLWSE
eukprot:TRINITY_DN67032_c2_g1_i1.p1 TRINITY_DN67032_c2_g1~~TRINITY_DN67032_c2_g1_i1.p1  ORF type:complete len:643 (+),score=375.74 TRINITY_DN67032_c2_g1_i1:56-1984(+)